MAVPVFAFDFFVPPCGGSGVCVCVCVCVLACVRLFVPLGRSSPLGSWGACVLLLFFAPPTHRKRGDKNHDGDDEQIFSPSRLFSTSRRHQRMSLRLTNEPLCDPSPIFFFSLKQPSPSKPTPFRHWFQVLRPVLKSTATTTLVKVQCHQLIVPDLASGG